MGLLDAPHDLLAPNGRPPPLPFARRPSVPPDFLPTLLPVVAGGPFPLLFRGGAVPVVLGMLVLIGPKGLGRKGQKSAKQYGSNVRG